MGGRRSRAKAEGSLLDMLLQRLSNVESVLIDLHWNQVGWMRHSSFSQDYGLEMSQPWSQSGAMCYSSMDGCSATNVDTTTDDHNAEHVLPDELMKTEDGLTVSMPKTEKTQDVLTVSMPKIDSTNAVPRVLSTGPSDLCSDSGEQEAVACCQGRWEQLPFLTESAIPNARAVSRSHFSVVEFLTRPEPENTRDSIDTSQLDREVDPRDMQSPGFVPNVLPPGVTTGDKCYASLRVVWPSDEELAADDVWDHFSAYGSILELDWLENCIHESKSQEAIRLYYDNPASVSKALQMQPHHVVREADGTSVVVKAHVKFQDDVNPQI